MKPLRHIVHLMLVVLVLVGTMGFTVNRHHCMGRVMDVVVNDTPKSCADGMDMEDTGCCHDSSEEHRIEFMTKADVALDSSLDWVLSPEIDFGTTNYRLFPKGLKKSTAIISPLILKGISLS